MLENQNNQNIQNKQNKPKNSLFASISNTLGLTVMTTATAVTAHHLWRKRSNPNAKFSDYLTGVAQQWQRIGEANSQARQAWQQTYYKTNHPKEPQNDQPQTDLTMQVADSLYPQTQTNSAHKPMPVKWISGVANKSSKSTNGEFDDFSVVGIDEHRQIVWQTPVAERVHDIVVQPTNGHCRHVAVMGRRPSEFFWILDCATGEILHHIQAEASRHFYGHACYSLDGSFLYVTENDTATYQGMIGVYEVASGYRKLDEFASHGIGCHEVILSPDGDKLIIANGGIKTDRASREELNLDSMQPSLVYLSLKQGEEGKLLQQVQPKHNQMSVRHISVVTEGEFKDTVAIGIQFQGEKHLNMPLVLTHKFGDNKFIEYTPKTDWRQFHHYIASIKVCSHQNCRENLICVTSPIGGCVSVFDMANGKMSGQMMDTVKIADCAGIAVVNNFSNDVLTFFHNQGSPVLAKNPFALSLSKGIGKVLKGFRYGSTGSPRTKPIAPDSPDLQKGTDTEPCFIVSDGQGGLTLLSVVDGKISTDTVTLPMAFDNHMQLVE